MAWPLQGAAVEAWSDGCAGGREDSRVPVQRYLSVASRSIEADASERRRLLSRMWRRDVRDSRGRIASRQASLAPVAARFPVVGAPSRSPSSQPDAVFLRNSIPAKIQPLTMTSSSSPSRKALSKIACNRVHMELAEWQFIPTAGFKHKVSENLQRWVI